MDGELWAMMLDAKRTFDDLIELHAPDAATRDAVLSNRIYKELSSAVAGSQEYMAMEKLHELHQEGRYDLLVLDTPPTRNALDFIDAPKKLSAFIDSRSLHFFTAPGFLGLKVFGRGASVLFSVMKRATGVDLLEDLAGFFRSFGDMAGGFRDRAEGVNHLLSDSRTAFVPVTSPRVDAIDEAVFFHRRLLDAGLPFAGVVANRVHPGLSEEDPAAELEQLVGGALAAKAFRHARRRAPPRRARPREPGRPARAAAPPSDDRGALLRRGRARPRGAAADGRVPVCRRLNRGGR